MDKYTIRSALFFGGLGIIYLVVGFWAAVGVLCVSLGLMLYVTEES